jgi:acetyltransferase
LDPAWYVTKWALKDGTPVTIRLICPADEPLMVQFHRLLSDDSVYFRYLGPLKLSQRIAHNRLIRVCLNRADHELALVATTICPETGKDAILGVGRLIKFEESNDAEFAVVVADPCQGSGLGTQLLRRLIRIARDEGRRAVIGYVLPSNRPMLHICEKLGFRQVRIPGDPVVKVERVLRPAPGAARA